MSLEGARAAAVAPPPPANMRRRPLAKQATVGGGGGAPKHQPKLSVQDFVRMDPGYTPNIEHLVFPVGRRRSGPQQVAPAPAQASSAGRARSRLADMFALGRHLQQRRSRDVDPKAQAQQKPLVRQSPFSTMGKRSIDSALDPPTSVGAPGGRRTASARRWVCSVEEATSGRQNSLSGGAGGVASRLAMATDTSASPGRGPNVSVLHLRSTSEPWEAVPSAPFGAPPAAAGRQYFGGRGPGAPPPLAKHQSLGGVGHHFGWTNSPNFHSGAEVNSPDMFTLSTTCSRELSPVRWCDREVDGVYLGRSGWVQVQQRSLDENRRTSYTGLSAAAQSRKVGVKLADYHFSSEPSQKREEAPPPPQQQQPQQQQPQQRPAYLSLRAADFERKSATPSPLLPEPEQFSPPSLTPIISPPPAFQDKTNRSPAKSRTFFGKTPFLPRSKAIEDSDHERSPPKSPPATKWKTAAPMAPSIRKPKPVVIEKPPRAFKRIPQTKSLEDTTAARRSQFLQNYRGSSSSSSSSMGFRSLDSALNRPGSVMPRLLEHVDSSVDVDDADEEDNNSSSINISIVSNVNAITQLELSRNREKEKVSPQGRSARQHLRTPLRRSPAGSDSGRPMTASTGASSSTSSGDEYRPPSRVSPQGGPPPQPQQQQPPRRSQTARAYPQQRSPQQPDDGKEALAQRVRRSRSLQLPEKKPPAGFAQRSPPQHPTAAAEQAHRVVVKVGGGGEARRPRQQRPVQVEGADGLDEEMLREAEVVAGFLYGSRTKAAAQALLMHRYNNSSFSKEEKPTKDPPRSAANNGLTVYYVGNNRKERQRLLLRGSTSPSLPSAKHGFEPRPEPPHSSFDRPEAKHAHNPCSSDTCDFWPHCAHRGTLHREAQFVMRSSQSYPSHQRSLDSATEAARSASIEINRKSQEQYKRRMAQEMERRIHGSRLSPNRREERKPSPVNPRAASRFGNVSGSSSGSDVWLTSGERRALLKGSGASTPVDFVPGVPKEDKASVSRPGSAPMVEAGAPPVDALSSQQRSMSLPKSFLSAGNYQQPQQQQPQQTGGQVPWQRNGTESLGSSPGFSRKIPTPETAHTAPVTPLHEGRRGRSPVGVGRRTKATSTPQLLEPDLEDRKWNDKTEISNDDYSSNPSGVKDFAARRSNSVQTSESVLQKFRKTFSLRFQRRGGGGGGGSDAGEGLSEGGGEPSEGESSPRRAPSLASSDCQADAPPGPGGGGGGLDGDPAEQKYKFGPLIWRSSKERKKLTKAARSAKCNSGDSGIQIEMAPGCRGAGDSSGDTDAGAGIADDEPDSPPAVRRRRGGAPASGKPPRPHSDLLNQILIDRLKADLRQRARARHAAVRRTRSDLGGRRLIGWAPPAPRRGASPPSASRPRRRPPGEPPDVALRARDCARPPARLRRSLSQPLDIDRLSPVVRATAHGLRQGASTVLSEDERPAGDCSDAGASDSEGDSSSLASLEPRRPAGASASSPEPDDDGVVLAEAVFDHVAIEADELAFRAGAVVEVLETTNREWWWGWADGRAGWFPANSVRLRVGQRDTVEDCLAAMERGGSRAPAQVRRRTSVSLLSNDQVRTSVVRELVHTERDFVKVLRDVVEGYITECRKRTDMFSDDQIDTIFINLENILDFQSSFLDDLEASINWDAPHKSCVGHCFLKHQLGFKMYSDYCNSHPMATAALQELYQYDNYGKFFEACRLMRGLMEIPLDGYLLTPVQRICKYPLQLAELLKYTKADHEDYDHIKEALEAMRGVAMLINERKRRMESLEKLAAWQQRVEGWEGEDLIELSSQLIYHGEVVRVTTGMWTNNITLFLFDHQIIYCKKDILKRSTYVYKGRIYLDTCEIIDIPDGKDIHLGVTVRHAIKLYSCDRDKWLMFYCRSSKEKQAWLDAFSEERRLVLQDKDEGLEFPPAARQLARLAARCQRRPPRKPGSGKSCKLDMTYMGSSLHLNSAPHGNSSILGRKVGTWFNFGAHKKTRHHQQDVF